MLRSALLFAVHATCSPCNHNLAVHARQLPYRCSLLHVISALPAAPQVCSVAGRDSAFLCPLFHKRRRTYAVGILAPRDKVKRALYWDTAGALNASPFS